VQVFEASTEAELLDKLVTAQENATRKIRDLAKTVKPAQQTTEKSELTADEEFILGQSMLTKPSEAFTKLFEKTVGMPLNAFKTSLERVNAFERAQARNDASTEFVKRNPDYYAIPANGNRLIAFLSANKLEHTVENLEKAYQDLNSGGLLEAKSAATNATTDDTAAANSDDTSRIEETEQEQKVIAPVVRKKAASGLSSSSRNAAPTRATGPTEQELYDMPLEQLRELAERQS
jgi:hypothetical protein